MGPEVWRGIDQWQTLIGAALGPFLAVVLSVLGYLLKTQYESRKHKRSALRRIESSTARSLNDFFVARRKLQNFANGLRSLASESMAEREDAYFLAEINFPAMADIFLDEELARINSGSVYLHNQLMFADAGLRDTNTNIKDLKNNYSTIIQKNAFLVTLNTPPPPEIQHRSFADNLRNFANSIDEFTNSFAEGIGKLVRIRSYNRKLMDKRTRTLWRNEWIHLKFFRNKKEIKKYLKWESIVERVDFFIVEDSNQMLAEAEARFIQLNGPLDPGP